MTFHTTKKRRKTLHHKQCQRDVFMFRKHLYDNLASSCLFRLILSKATSFNASFFYLILNFAGCLHILEPSKNSYQKVQKKHLHLPLFGKAVKNIFLSKKNLFFSYLSCFWFQVDSSFDYKCSDKEKFSGKSLLQLFT